MVQPAWRGSASTREGLIEAWKPSLMPGDDGLTVLSVLWRVLSPGWRIAVKRFPVKGPGAVRKERVLTKAEAAQRIEVIASCIERTGVLPL
ncbi:MAG: hypothetical protein QOG87_4347 [Actinomycetota bacterium]|jgi:hypothetical protein